MSPEELRELLIAQVARTVGAFEASSTKNRPSGVLRSHLYNLQKTLDRYQQAQQQREVSKP